MSLDKGAVTALLESVGHDRAFVAELVGTFLEESPVQLAELQGAAARGDAYEVRRVAHTLKSNAATFGIVSLEDACRELEQRAHDGDLGDADVLVPSIGNSLAEARPALDGLTTSGSV